jgi:Predicted AAA-ATPase
LTPNVIAADKTKFIAELDTKSEYQYMYLRPRRWGKSTFLRTLATYYDKTKREDFESNFGELYVGKHPTKDRSSLLVLLLDFSGIGTLGGLDTIKEDLNRIVCEALTQFLEANSDFLPHSKPEKYFVNGSAAESLERVMVSVIPHLI